MLPYMQNWHSANVIKYIICNITIISSILIINGTIINIILYYLSYIYVLPHNKTIC